MNVSALSDRLRRHSPLLYHVTRPPWRVIKKLLSKLGYYEMQPEPSYWEVRRNHDYYREVVRLAQVYASSGGQVIDVGASETEVLQRLDWFRRRVALDLDDVPPQPNIEAVVMDFMAYQPESEFDLVICLQVLEHLKEPAVFARKLLETGRTINH